MYRQHRLREIGLRRGVSRDKNGLRQGLAGLNRTWTFDPCTPCLKLCTPTFKILPNSLLAALISWILNKIGLLSLAQFRSYICSIRAFAYLPSSQESLFQISQSHASVITCVYYNLEKIE